MSTEKLSAPFQTADEAVNWIESLRPHGIRPGLERMHALLEKFEHPHRRLNFIHVAGTNGKGSTCAMLAEVLRCNAYDVGMFTSPYLQHFTDRIRFNGVPIADESMLQWCNKIYPHVVTMQDSEWGPPSLFELTTLLAILYFAYEACPYYVVWETGLGGTLDCTNVVNPVVCVITAIGHDHGEILGESLEEIAAQKAGIIKPGVPIISTVLQPEAQQVIRETALAKKSTLYQYEQDFHIDINYLSEADMSLNFNGPFQDYRDVVLGLSGRYQSKNAAAALMTIEVLRQYMVALIEEEHVLTGFRQVRWPGRLERIAQERIAGGVVLDGAHNPEGMEALVESIEELYSYQKLVVLIGMLQSKKHTDTLRHIIRIADTIILTKVDFGKTAEPQALREICLQLADEEQVNPKIFAIEELSLAVEQWLEDQQEDTLRLAAGSLYLISDVRAMLLEIPGTSKGW